MIRGIDSMQKCKLRPFQFVELVFVQNDVVHLISDNLLQIYLSEFTNTHTHPKLKKVKQKMSKKKNGKVVFIVDKWS